ncbi:sulfite exporter TauE/SafE family protein [Oceanimonas pelagia]|uniref:Probable membrane transporter protein n=1 Tax=Oceanimonas pelagia TaxID=3028314 RepID=A0AA50Q7Z4_9GAMM|nr:sulfite exporter TauE/SafE family protein [Oceanimonas pelagia]WMC11140.1 sulfite exporter TauE/SafE family protein [Oceanimonas pelagia]
MLYSASELLALLIVTGGILVQAWVGIGFGLLAAPLLYLLDPAYVPGPVLMLGWGLSMLVVLKQRHRLNWRRVCPAILARLPGSWCGALLLVSLATWQLSLLFGCALLLAVWLSGRRVDLALTPSALTVAGFCSGVLGTATSVGGPPMALLYQHQPRLTTRDELAVFFLAGTPLSLLMLVLEGGTGLLALPLVLKLLPGVALGFWLSRWLELRVHKDSARPAILLISALSALGVLWQGIKAGLLG